MKKKMFLGVLLAVICVSLFACGKTTENFVSENMSEVTRVYFAGEGEEVYVTLASGEREEKYVVDGKSGKDVKFALLTLDSDKLSADVVKVTISIDGQASEREVERAVNGQYMLDLEQALTGKEEICIVLDGEEIALENLSEGFVVDSAKAIDIACKELNDEIRDCKNGSELGAECYLRVMNKKANNFDKVYWCFSVVNVKGENHSVIISTEDGSVLAKG